jgi:Rps23 Pro-64 3,4-dihydroxylase Tpa1-like proline 4-hydroxylase
MLSWCVIGLGCDASERSVTWRAMSTATNATTSGVHFDAERLCSLARSLRDGYATARPFPHVVIDDFLAARVLDEVLEEFPSPRRADWESFESPVERKLATKDESMMGEATRRVLAEFNSAAFIDFLEELTGIEGLVPDPHFWGGGLHQIERGGHLKVHADFNLHPHTGLERRLNVLVYLNRDWKEEFGGALELWSRDMRTCEAKIFPLFNRCVVFSTTDTSFHGHPEPLNCPEGLTRKSIALYYYSRSGESFGAGHNTLFQARPGEDLPRAPVAEDPAQSAAQSPTRERVKRAIGLVTPPIVIQAVDSWRRQRARRA